LPDTVRLILLFGIGSVVMRAAGCVVNDLWDRDIDRLVARTAGRPLASGAIRPRQALFFLTVLLGCGLLVLLSLNRLAQGLGVASLALVAVYPLAKRVTWWPQLVMGFTFGFGAPMGYAAAAGRIDLSWWLIYAAAIFWDLGFDTIYAHQDKDDDALMGLKSTAIKFGDSTPFWLSLFYGITIGGIAFCGWLVDAGAIFYCVLAAGAAHLIWQVATLDLNDPQNCLERFRSNQAFGAIIFAALILDIIPAAS